MTPTPGQSYPAIASLDTFTTWPTVLAKHSVIATPKTSMLPLLFPTGNLSSLSIRSRHPLNPVNIVF